MFSMRAVILWSLSCLECLVKFTMCAILSCVAECACSATISRRLEIIGLFCKRALQKRLYSAKETYNFMKPTSLECAWSCHVWQNVRDRVMFRKCLELYWCVAGAACNTPYKRGYILAPWNRSLLQKSPTKEAIFLWYLECAPSLCALVMFRVLLSQSHHSSSATHASSQSCDV